MNSTYQKVGIGVTVLVLSNKRILLAKRKGSHGAGTWDTPGGHLEPGESILDCALRETREETNLELNPNCIIELGFTEDFFITEKKHYISCVVSCEVEQDVMPMHNEPLKFETTWSWYSFFDMPSPLFTPVANALKKFKLI